MGLKKPVNAGDTFGGFSVVRTNVDGTIVAKCCLCESEYSMSRKVLFDKKANKTKWCRKCAQEKRKGRKLGANKKEPNGWTLEGGEMAKRFLSGRL